MAQKELTGEEFTQKMRSEGCAKLEQYLRTQTEPRLKYDVCGALDCTADWLNILLEELRGRGLSIEEAGYKIRLIEKE